MAPSALCQALQRVHLAQQGPCIVHGRRCQPRPCLGYIQHPSAKDAAAQPHVLQSSLAAAVTPQLLLLHAASSIPALCMLIEATTARLICVCMAGPSDSTSSPAARQRTRCGGPPCVWGPQQSMHMEATSLRLWSSGMGRGRGSSKSAAWTSKSCARPLWAAVTSPQEIVKVSRDCMALRVLRRPSDGHSSLTPDAGVRSPKASSLLCCFESWCGRCPLRPD